MAISSGTPLEPAKYIPEIIKCQNEGFITVTFFSCDYCLVLAQTTPNGASTWSVFCVNVTYCVGASGAEL